MGEVRATCHSRFSRLSLEMCCLSSLGAAGEGQEGAGAQVELKEGAAKGGT